MGAARAVVVIGGSTASGKSALAMALAHDLGGVVVNADSQQLFRDLPTLTARPTPADEATTEHRLYGVLGADEPPSAGRWLDLVGSVLEELLAVGRLPIITGGSPLYLEALLRGFVTVPSIPADLRAQLRTEAARAEPAELHRRLRAIDPVMAARLRQSDPQRVLRALEVRLATGRSLAEWQAEPARAVSLPATVGVALVPPAGVVAARVEERLQAMIRGGAVDEVRELAARRPDLVALPIAKVHGARELLAVAEGRIDLAAAIASIGAQVRRYAKRQRTYLRHRLAMLQPFATVGSDLEPGDAVMTRLEALARRTAISPTSTQPMPPP